LFLALVNQLKQNIYPFLVNKKQKKQKSCFYLSISEIICCLVDWFIQPHCSNTLYGEEESNEYDEITKSSFKNDT
jgi:hypothetical protein